MKKTIKETFEEIQAFQVENPEQKRSGCLFEQDASGETLKGYTIEDEIFKQCNFYTAKLINCHFINCTFLHCNFSYLSSYGNKFTNCKFYQCDFTQSILADTIFTDCTKENCNLNNLHCSGTTKGISLKDQNIVQDNLTTEEDEEINNNEAASESRKSFNTHLLNIMKNSFSNWELIDSTDTESEYILTDDAQKIQLALYSDPEKNSTDTDNFWDLSIFYNNVSLLTTDINMFGLTDDEVINQIKTWENEILKDNAEMLITKIIDILEKR